LTSDEHATAWLSVLDDKYPAVFGTDIDTGVKPTKDVLFHRFKYFFHLMIACEHCNDQKIGLFYYYNYYMSLPNFYLKKNRFDSIVDLPFRITTCHFLLAIVLRT